MKVIKITDEIMKVIKGVRRDEFFGKFINSNADALNFLINWAYITGCIDTIIDFKHDKISDEEKTKIREKYLNDWLLKRREKGVDEFGYFLYCLIKENIYTEENEYNDTEKGNFVEEKVNI